MTTQDTQRILERQLQRLQLDEQAATADYNAHLYSHDDDAAADALMQIAQARQQRETLVQQWNAELERNREPYVSDEQRAGRKPEELDATDLADIMNQSKYSGKSFTAADYNNLRRGLGWYRTNRGQEGR